MRLDRLIATRALNYLRATHMPTYVGLRFLLDSLPPTESSIAATTLVEKLALATSQRLYSVKRFKALSNDNSYAYRDYFVPSPTHALSEAYALAVLDNAGLRRKLPNIYSYLPPPNDSYPRNYAHFAQGYRNRNSDISMALVGNNVAIVVDLKNCYPSIRAPHVVSEYLASIDGPRLNGKSRRVIAKCAQACIEPEKGGLRIGPDFSHLLSDFALRELDDELSQRFGKLYFRYVDDIVIVVDRNAAPLEMRELKNAIESHGFRLNESKTHIAEAGEWNQHEQQLQDSSQKIDVLSAFKFRLKNFLVRHPDDVDRIDVALREMGIFLPIRSFAEATGSVRWRDQIYRLWTANWGVLVKYYFDEFDDIVHAAHEAQQLVRHELSAAMQLDLGESVLVRKWRIQQARYAINRALYVLGDVELKEVLSFLSEVPEMAETRAVVLALVSGDFSEVLRMPGPAASAAAQLTLLRGKDVKGLFASLFDAPKNDVAADVAAQFGVRGFPAEGDLVELESDTSNASSVLRFSFGAARNSGRAFGYGAELESLGIGRSVSEMAQASTSRLLPREDVVLDALSLSSAYAS
jgi:hypothetical protein